MNRIITKYVTYRGQKISVDDLKPNSNIKIEVECKHGRRMVKWCRRQQLCRKCCSEAGTYNTSPKGRKITWGDKISKAKKGKKLSVEHKRALVAQRKTKYCQRVGIKETDFVGFPTSGLQFKLRCFLMAAMQKIIIKTNVDEQDRLFREKLGYSVAELRTHLEQKFQSGMSWKNYGKWHIDHVRPESWFQYRSHNDPEFKKCWALSNLQPLWAHENLKKNSLYEGEYKERKIYMLVGQSGVGKTTMANMLSNKFTIIEYDDYNMKNLDRAIRNNWFNKKPILLVVPVKISTLYKRYSIQYAIHMVAILEPTEIIKQRIISRGGTQFSSLKRRNKRLIVLAASLADFSGDFQTVLSYFQNLPVN
jgi:hypothetical protein